MNSAAHIHLLIGSLKAGFVTERSELGSCKAFRVQSHANRRKTRVNHTYLWNVAEKRFFKSFPFEPFFTNLAALEALFTFSSATRTENTPTRRRQSQSPRPPWRARIDHHSRDARAPPIAPCAAETHARARCAYTYPSSSAPSSSSSSSCVVKGRLRRARDARRARPHPGTRTDRFLTPIT